MVGAMRGKLTRVSYCVIVLGLVVGQAVALEPALSSAAGPVGPACAETTLDTTTAVGLARSCGRPVEVLSGRTPWQTLTAQPSGELTWQTSTRAQRTDVNGAWEPIDTTLAPGPDGPAPVAPALPMSFSPGGTGAPLARLAYRGRVLEMRWPGSLPTPRLSGSSVTYPGVLPGVDLVVTVDEDGTGWSEVLVVQGPAAAANPALAEVSFPLRTDGGLRVVPRSDGLVALDAAGTEVFTSPTPRMWDSAGRGATMPVRLAGDTLTIVPDAGMLADPTLSWPLYIDPTWDAGEGVTLNAWAMIQSGFGGDDENYKNWTNEGLGLCDVAADSACVQDNVKRLLYHFNIPAGIRGSVVSSAEFSAYQTHAWDCDTGSVRLYKVSPFSSSVNWDNFHTQMDGTNYIASKNETRKSGCPLGPGWTRLNATSAAADAAEASAATLHLGIRSANETSMASSWKRFNSNAALSITFNRYPNTPGLPSLDPATTTGTGPSGYFSRDATPALRATVSDPDGGNVRGRFRVYNGGTMVWEGLSGYVASGGTAQLSVGVTLAEGPLYTVRVFSNDSALDSKTWSAFIQFTVDVTPPAAVPGVTPKSGEPAVYVEDGWAGGVGVSGKFFFTNGGITGVTGYRYSFNSTSLGQSVGLSGGANGQSLDVSFIPSTVGGQTLRVVSVDAAGWVGPERLYLFNVDFPGEDGLWRLNEGSGTTAADSSGSGNPLTLTDTTWTTGPGADFGFDPSDTALRFDSSTDVGVTASHVVATNSSFTVMAFVKLEASTATHAAVSQDGAYTSGFKLGHAVSGCPTTSGVCWALSMFTADSPTSGATVRAASPIEVVVGEWVHLTGVYDATAGQLRLFVCELGTPAAPKAAQPIEATQDHTSTWNAVGPLRVGRGQYRGSFGDSFPGVIDDVRVYAEIVPIETIRLICQGAA
jgi:hypothetical protein